jgi:propanediol dehydratase small subunit
VSTETPERDAGVRRSQRAIYISDITLENVRLGKLSADDLTIQRGTLLQQAKRADDEGYPQLARDFRRRQNVQQFQTMCCWRSMKN